MPYQISITKKVDFGDTDKYFNECCYGGDVIQNVLLPDIQKSYQNVQADQEDWGWFIWFKDSSKKVYLAIDIFCDDPQAGDYRILLISRTKKWMGLISSVVDMPELDTLSAKVIISINEWAGVPCQSQRLDANYAPIKEI